MMTRVEVGLGVRMLLLVMRIVRTVQSGMCAITSSHQMDLARKGMRCQARIIKITIMGSDRMVMMLRRMSLVG